MGNNFYMFLGHWCGACHSFLEELEKNDVDGFDIVYVEDLPELANNYEIKTLPTLVSKDDPCYRLEGCHLVQDVCSFLNHVNL